MPKNECEKCELSYKDPLFWETHQTMSDNSIWCVNIRKGQKAFNDLYESNPEIANKIRGTIFDPFYQDSRIEAFNLKVKELLNE